MTRSCALAVLVLGVCWLSAFAQGGGGDPDAKGSVTIDLIEVKDGATFVWVTRDASVGWDMDTVDVFAIDPLGGYLYAVNVVFEQKAGQPPPKSGAVIFPLPNGTFDVWANHLIVEKNPPNSTQRVGSALTSVTVTQSTFPKETEGGTITCSPVRTADKKGFTASGTYTISAGWKQDPNNKKVNFYAMPTVGGKIRELNVDGGEPDKDGKRPWTTAPNTLAVPSELKYNCFATHAVIRNDGKYARAIASAWQKDK